MSTQNLRAEPAITKIRLASAIGPIDAGIVGALEAAFMKKTGIQVEHKGAGTGHTLKMAGTGKFDLVLVHAKALKEKFVADGFGIKRYDLMYNDFVILGPSRGPGKDQRDKGCCIGAEDNSQDPRAVRHTRR